MRYIPGCGSARCVVKHAVLFKDRMVVDEKLQILADHEHVKQLFVDQLEFSYRPLFPGISNQELEPSAAAAV